MPRTTSRRERRSFASGPDYQALVEQIRAQVLEIQSIARGPVSSSAPAAATNAPSGNAQSQQIAQLVAVIQQQAAQAAKRDQQIEELTAQMRRSRFRGGPLMGDLVPCLRRAARCPSAASTSPVSLAPMRSMSARTRSTSVPTRVCTTCWSSARSIPAPSWSSPARHYPLATSATAPFVLDRSRCRLDPLSRGDDLALDGAGRSPFQPLGARRPAGPDQLQCRPSLMAPIRSRRGRRAPACCGSPIPAATSTILLALGWDGAAISLKRGNEDDLFGTCRRWPA